MAITFDAPSTNWQTESRTTAEPRIFYPIPQNKSAIFYEDDFTINEENWTTSALDSVMATDTLNGGIDISQETITVDSTDGFPTVGVLKIDSEEITYTGRTATTFTGGGRGAKGTSPALHLDGATVDAAIYLVDETPPISISGGMVDWTKKFATIPDDWSDFSESVFQFPGYYNDDTETNYRCPQNLNCTIKTTSTYVQTLDPYTNLDVANQMFRVIDSDSCVFDYVDDTTTPDYATYYGNVSSGTLLYAAQSTLERFAGNIWAQHSFQTKSQ